MRFAGLSGGCFLRSSVLEAPGPSPKIPGRTHDVERLLVALFLRAHPRPPEQIVLDVDATDDPIHGHPLGRSFHGYYREYCSPPLDIRCGDHRLCARPRPAGIDASAGSVKRLTRIVEPIRREWPEVKIAIRADSGSCREPLMARCEANGVDYVLGLAQDPRLVAAIADGSGQARQQFEVTGQRARAFAESRYRTSETWSRERRVVAKAEHLAKGADPRFVVTSLSAERRPARPLYGDDSCGRGEAEDRIKEVWVHPASSGPYAEVSRRAHARLSRLRPVVLRC